MNKINFDKIIFEASELIELSQWNEISWYDVLKYLSESLPGSFIHSVHHSPMQNKSLSLTWYGIDDRIAYDYEEHYIKIDPWAHSLANLNSGSIVSAEKFMPASTFINTEYYCDHLCKLKEGGAWTGLLLNANYCENFFISINYSRTKSIFYDDLCQMILKELKSKILNTINIHKGISSKKMEGNISMLSKILTRDICIVVDERYKLHWMNDLAESFLNSGVLFSIKNDVCFFKDKILNEWLGYNIKKLSGTPVSAFTPFLLNCAPFLFLVGLKRISQSFCRPLLYEPAMILITISQLSGSVFSMKNVELLRECFNLTKTEIRLCQNLHPSLGLSHAARNAGISYEHARQRIKIIYQKLQVSNYTELLVFLSKINDRH